MQEYLQANPSEKLSRLANEELQKALLEINEYDYQTAIKPERGDQTDLNQLETALRGYLEKHAEGSHRLDVLERLEQIPARRDDRAFARALANVKTAGEDLGMQGAAWQIYLEQYPDGLHATQARASIARIPDQIDELRLRELLSETQPLIAADRLTDAILHLEAGTRAIQSPQRRDRLAEQIAELAARLELTDAAECLALPVSTDDERRLATARYRLYLLCYPGGASRQAIEERTRDLVRGQREELLAALRAKLAEIGDDPLAALAALDEFRRQPAAADADVTRDLARNRFDLLERTVNSSLQNVRIITYQDGTMLAGAVSEVSSGWVQVKPRTVGEEEKPPSRLVRTTEITMTEPALRQALDDLSQRVLALLTADPVDLGRIVAEIRATRRLAEGELFRPEWLAFQVCLAGLDSSDDEIRRELTAAGYVPYNGVYRAAATLPKIAAAGDSPQQAAMDYFIAYGREHAPLDALRARLAESFDYSFLGTMLTIPIEWDLDEPECQPTLLSGVGDPFQAKLVFTYPARARRKSDSTLPTSILSELDRELVKLNQATKVRITDEIRTQVERLTGVGIETRPRDADLVVNRVFPGSSAARAGVEAGDRIALVDGRPLPDGATSDTLALLIANGPLDGVNFAFVRSGRRFEVVLERGDYTIDKCQMRSEIETSGSLSKESINSISEWIDVPAPS